LTNREIDALQDRVEEQKIPEFSEEKKENEEIKIPRAPRIEIPKEIVSQTKPSKSNLQTIPTGIGGYVPQNIKDK
jgi:hypothetical protein